MLRPDDAFDEFAVAAWPRLHWTAFLLCGDRHLAEDLTQTALVRTYAAWSRVRREDAYAYARRTLVNANIDRLRRRRVDEVGERDLVDREGPRDPTGTVDDADLLVRVLAGLTPRERRVLVLRHYWQLSESAAAAELGVRVGTVKSTTSRALAKVRAAHPELVGTRGAC